MPCAATEVDGLAPPSPARPYCACPVRIDESAPWPLAAAYAGGACFLYAAGAGSKGGPARAGGMWLVIGWRHRRRFSCAGRRCTWNDITDRDIDAAVTRTQVAADPLGEGDSETRALVWLGWFAVRFSPSLIAADLSTTQRHPARLASLAEPSRPTTCRQALSPWWPQVFLGLAFNWGALLCGTAQAGRPGLAGGGALPSAARPGAVLPTTNLTSPIQGREDECPDRRDPPRWLFRQRTPACGGALFSSPR